MYTCEKRLSEMSKKLTKEKVLPDLPDGDGSTTESDSDIDSDSDDSSSDSDYECTICKKKFSGAIPLRQHEKGSKHKKVLARKKKEQKLLNKSNDSEEDEEGSENFIPEPFQICKVCDKQFSGPEPYHLHLKSKSHKQKVYEASILEMVREKGEINVEKLKNLYKIKKRGTAGEDLPDSNKETLASVNLEEEEEEDEESNKGEYECKDCEKTFCGLKPFTQHLVSKTHAKQVGKKNLLSKIIDKAKGEPSDGSLISDISTLSLEDDTLVCKACSTAFSGPGNALSHVKSQKHAKKLEKYIKKLQKKKKEVVEPEEPGSESPVNEDTRKPENKEKDETPEERDEPDIKSETVKTEDSITSSDEDTEDSNSSSEEETKDLPVSGEKQHLTTQQTDKYELYKEALHSLKQEDKILQ